MAHRNETKTQANIAERNKRIRLSLYAHEFFKSLPLPAWVKVSDGKGGFKMLCINQAYEDTYGIIASDYEGQPDSVHWTASEAKRFEDKDHEVFRVGEPIAAVSVVTNRLTAETERVSCIKWALVYKGKVIGVAGIIVERSIILNSMWKNLLQLLPLWGFKLIKFLAKGK